VGRFNGDSYVNFLKQLLADYKGKIILIEMAPLTHDRQVVQDIKLANATHLTMRS
jgi:hypothetical protein